ncbi:MAG: hypothetical protein ACRC2R_20680 [Xenococcaceae cyanobacterium]
MEKELTTKIDNDSELYSEEKLAELLGFSSGTQKNKVGIIERAPTSEEFENDAEMFIDSSVGENPHRVKTKETFAQNPLMQFGLIGIITAMVVGIAGVFLQSMFAGGDNKNLVAQEPKEDDKKLEKENEEQIEGDYKGQTALYQQEQLLKALDKEQEPPKIQLVKTKPKTAPRIQRAVTPPPPRPIPQPIRIEPARSIQPAPPRREQQQPKYDTIEKWMKLAKMGSYGEVKAQKKESKVRRDLLSRVRSHRTQTVANRETSTPSDRFEPTQYGFAPVKSSPVLIASRELPRALPKYIDARSIPQLQSQQNIYSPSVNLESLRQSPLEDDRTQTTGSTISETTPIEATLPTESSSLRRDRFASRPLSDSLVDVRAIKKATIGEQKDEPKTPDAIEEENLMRSIEQNNLSLGFPSDNYDRSLEINTNEETSILEGRSPQMLQIGQQVQAHLLTPVMWAEDNKDNLAVGQEHFMVQLDRPLVDVRGREVVSAGSQLVFEIGSIHESGLVISKAVSLIKDGVEYALPPEVIKIRGNSGNALIAKLHKTDDGDSFDVAMFGLGALSKVGEIVNRPKSTFSSSSLYGQSSSSNYGDTNYLGAILEGGLQPMLDGAIQERQSQRQQQNRNSWFWTLDAGQTVQVFINNSFEL